MNAVGTIISLRMRERDGHITKLEQLPLNEARYRALNDVLSRACRAALKESRARRAATETGPVA